MEHYTQKYEAAMDDDDNREAVEALASSGSLEDPDVAPLSGLRGARTSWNDGRQPRITVAGKEPMKRAHFIDDEAEELDEPDLADYFGQFQMSRNEVILFCRTYASALARQEAYAKKFLPKRVKKD